MPFPFEVGFDDVRSNLDSYVDAVFGCLESEFLVMPKGKGFVEFPAFEAGHESLKRTTGNFREITSATVASAVFEAPISLIVLRCMLGFTPPEWAYFTSQYTDVKVTQNAARMIDRNIRVAPDTPLPGNGSATERRVRAMIAAACTFFNRVHLSFPRTDFIDSIRPIRHWGLTVSNRLQSWRSLFDVAL